MAFCIGPDLLFFRSGFLLEVFGLETLLGTVPEGFGFPDWSDWLTGSFFGWFFSFLSWACNLLFAASWTFWSGRGTFSGVRDGDTRKNRSCGGVTVGGEAEVACPDLASCSHSECSRFPDS